MKRSVEVEVESRRDGIGVEVESRRVGGDSHVSHGVAEALGAAADCVAEVVHKERDKEKGKSPHTPLKEKETEKETFPEPVPEHRARTCAGAGAREEASRSGAGAVDIRHGISGAGSANRVKVDRDFIMNPEYDAVQIALLVLHIPESTPGYNNARMMRWALRIVGEEEFRDLVYRQWRENTLDGSAKNAAAAFQAKLNCAVFGPKGGAR